MILVYALALSCLPNLLIFFTVFCHLFVYCKKVYRLQFIDRLQLLPAALEEFETRLQQNVFSLEKLIKNGRSNSLTDASDGNALGINERRTRQKSKKENKV